MAVQRNALGKGLGALLQSPPRGDEAATKEAAPAGKSINEISVDMIDPNPEQPRRVFDPDQLESLAESIRQYGVLQPIVVCEHGDRYELQVGERRWRATQAAGLSTIPAVVANIAPSDRLEVALIENIQRDDLNPIELALSFKALQDRGATQEQIGHHVGIDRSSVANHIRLLELGKELQQDVEHGEISMGHAKVLLSLPNSERRIHLRDRIVKEELSVRRAEELGRAFSSPGRPRSRAARVADPALIELTDVLRDRLKTKVLISGNQAKGRIEIHYAGEEDLRRLASALLEGQS